MQGKHRIPNPSQCHSTAENNVSWAASFGIISCMPNISQPLGAYGCAGLPLTPVIQRSENKAGMEAGWLMLTAHGVPARKHWKGDWQEFAYESGGNESVACNDMSCSSAPQTRARPIPAFHSQRVKRWRHLCRCPSALQAVCQTLDHTRTLSQFPTHHWLKSPLVQISRCWQLTPSHARCWRVKKVTNIYVHRREPCPGHVFTTPQ